MTAAIHSSSKFRQTSIPPPTRPPSRSLSTVPPAASPPSIPSATRAPPRAPTPPPGRLGSARVGRGRRLLPVHLAVAASGDTPPLAAPVSAAFPPVRSTRHPRQSLAALVTSECPAVATAAVTAAATASGHLRRCRGALPSTPAFRRVLDHHPVPAPAPVPGFRSGCSGPRPPRPASARRGLPRGYSGARRRGKRRFRASVAAAAGDFGSDGGRLTPAAAATAGAIAPGRTIRQPAKPLATPSGRRDGIPGM